MHYNNSTCLAGSPLASMLLQVLGNMRRHIAQAGIESQHSTIMAQPLQWHSVQLNHTWQHATQCLQGLVT